MLPSPGSRLLSLAAKNFAGFLHLEPLWEAGFIMISKNHQKS
ncbi:hypothetical protein B4098_1515 [Heyndrickxia coagulans]|uniref:Uncharacterized protein n=1 Tax=Heyndrickxia coagulans TaxID=1398 RepID=A0A150JPZ4_HEYCO|nr:hypothetical protein B4098_1515 [Heyndrickxia coagulans]KYC72834.1 hypothetical protein B4099_1751 [Heyndrickxia coagulans]